MQRPRAALQTSVAPAKWLQGHLSSAGHARHCQVFFFILVWLYYLDFCLQPSNSYRIIEAENFHSGRDLRKCSHSSDYWKCYRVQDRGISFRKPPLTTAHSAPRPPWGSRRSVLSAPSTSLQALSGWGAWGAHGSVSSFQHSV